LTSIVQGVALYFLIDNARGVLSFQRERDSAGEASNRLYALVTRDQWLNIGALVPALFLLNLACAICIRTWPGFFIARDGHVWLAAAQFVSFGVYLLYVLRFFRTLAPLISRARQEWHSGSNISTE
jgi:hypothetical protein